ncbi:hypothetical protein LPC08_24000 [Roseomonas sp. OT10]|uniref:hypothetical protein n=1 Tax=Roseomonas cutis TaxID=2897332 RepID=UPI001E4C0E41|nr:hypothetical protein [Roseomonas sp. OT10]UFN49021.1 hypothetical protein LPC08_24000 [Roseomonas sp. OT10]
MAEETLREEFSNWGGGTKSARPTSVGPHDVKADQEDPSNPGLDPGKDYKPSPQDSAATAAPDQPEKEFANIPVKPGETQKQGAPRDAPPLTSLAEE